MQLYQVGGCVRDRLLGRAVKDRDWVVVGSNATEMEQLGFRRVGKDFPVYLHPETGEEYALARTETPLPLELAGRKRLWWMRYSDP